MGNDSHLEIERRFLIDKPPANLDQYPHADVTQGYVSEKPPVRFRHVNPGKYYMTIKQGPLEAHEEREAELTQEQFEEFWPLTKGRRLFKTRYKIPHGDLTVEFDIFHGNHTGLMIAEVEFDGRAAGEAFRPLEWFGDEITGDGRYTNSALANE